MQFKRRILLRIGAALTGAAVAFAAVLCSKVPDTLYLSPGQSLTISGMPFLQPMSRTQTTAVAGGSSAQSQMVGLFGLLPLKRIHIQIREKEYVTVRGTPFGIKMFADGAMVVGFSDVFGTEGWRSPGKDAGLRMGDILVSVGGIQTTGNDDVQKAVQAAQGNPVEVVYTREGRRCTTTLTPVRAQDGSYKAGVWVRDSSAGIGTLTFIKKNGIYGGLGHPISDADTGQTIQLLSGEIVPVEITGVKIGQSGSPGELQGRFSGNTTGNILINGASGVYGRMTEQQEGLWLPVAHRQEVERGEAVIYTSIDDTGPHAYTVRIRQANLTSEKPNRDMLIEVTDPVLLEKTGGIVQGMSGSPLIQNGHLVGAVTHVLVNDPTCGYAIFAENMLETAEILEKDTENQAA